MTVDDSEDEDILVSDVESSKAKSGIWSSLTSLVGNKQLTASDVEPVISKMRDHLIGKNVASDVANKLCQSVASKLEGKVLGTLSENLSVFESMFSVASTYIMNTSVFPDYLTHKFSL